MWRARQLGGAGAPRARPAHMHAVRGLNGSGGRRRRCGGAPGGRAAEADMAEGGKSHGLAWLVEVCRFKDFGKMKQWLGWPAFGALWCGAECDATHLPVDLPALTPQQATHKPGKQPEASNRVLEAYRSDPTAWKPSLGRGRPAWTRPGGSGRDPASPPHQWAHHQDLWTF